MSEELQVVPIEERISNELVKHNVTEAIIAKLREDYLPLKIAGIEDKETYLLVKEARKKCKEIRVLAKKICVDGREDAVSIQKAWVAKEKDVTGRISEVEDYLEKQEKEYEAAVAKEKEDRKRKQEEQLIMRQQVLTNMGALYSDGSFHLGEVSFELSVVKESEPDIWEESILPKYKEEYEKVEAERIEQERIKQEREAEMKRQQDELDKKQKELEQKEAELKKAEEEKIRKDQEEELKKERERVAKQVARFNSRCNELASLGMIHDFVAAEYSYEDVIITNECITCSDDLEWAEVVLNAKTDIGRKKEEEIKRVLGESRMKALKDLGRVPKDATRITLSDLSEEEYDTLYANEKREYEAFKRAQWQAEQEENRKQEELKSQQELEQAKDKEKWEEILSKVKEIEVYEMNTGP